MTTSILTLSRNNLVNICKHLSHIGKDLKAVPTFSQKTEEDRTAALIALDMATKQLIAASDHLLLFELHMPVKKEVDTTPELG